jgi:hypothetical protein
MFCDQPSVSNVQTVALPDRTGEQVGPHQGADVRDHPVGAGLDEEVVPQVIEVAADRGHLAGDHAEEGLKRPALLGVVDPVVGGHARVETVREVQGVVTAHASTKPPLPSATTSVPLAGSAGSS